MNLTILQRMLIAPGVALLLYSLYLVVAHGEHKRASETLTEIRDASLPLMEMASENVLLFEAMTGQIKDAVLAGEKEWLDATQINRRQIAANLSQMTQFSSQLSTDQISRLKTDFNLYYANAYTLSLVLLGEKSDGLPRDQLIANVEQYHQAVSQGFANIREQVRQHVDETVATTDRRLHMLLISGVGIAIMLIILVIGITLILSIATRRSLNQMIRRMRNLAEGNPDFSQRLAAHDKDEMGVLAGWFNLLSEKLEQDYKKIELLSITDKLTQLYNRTKIDQIFDQQFTQIQRYPTAMAVILIDLDHFKSVNDQYGHQCGDQVLQKLAGILKANVRSSDFVGRWGGEEFIVIAPNTHLDSALQVAEKLRQMIANASFPTSRQHTASFGIATYRPGDDADSITRRADEALYEAKAAGRNRVIIEPSHSESVPQAAD